MASTCMYGRLVKAFFTCYDSLQITDTRSSAPSKTSTVPYIQYEYENSAAAAADDEAVAPDNKGRRPP